MKTFHYTTFTILTGCIYLQDGLLGDIDVQWVEKGRWQDPVELDRRIEAIGDRLAKTQYSRKKNALENELNIFLSKLDASKSLQICDNAGNTACFDLFFN